MGRPLSVVRMEYMELLATQRGLPLLKGYPAGDIALILYKLDDKKVDLENEIVTLIGAESRHDLKFLEYIESLG